DPWTPTRQLAVRAERLDDRVGAHVDVEARDVETRDVASGGQQRLRVVEALAAGHQAEPQPAQVRAVEPLLCGRLDRQARGVAAARRAADPHPGVRRHPALADRLEEL